MNFCKFKNSDMCDDCEKMCPTISNIVSKLEPKVVKQLRWCVSDKIDEIKWIFSEHYYKIKYKNYKAFSNTDNGEYKFIWGGSENSNFYTLNDIQLLYNRKSKKYTIDIETAYMFRNDKDECEYLRELLGKFKSYIDSKGIKPDYPIFYMSNPIVENEADSIGELYVNFKMFVDAWCTMKGE